jgi:hypothetical protein
VNLDGRLDSIVAHKVSDAVRLGVGLRGTKPPTGRSEAGSSRTADAKPTT